MQNYNHDPDNAYILVRVVSIQGAAGVRVGLTEKVPRCSAGDRHGKSHGCTMLELNWK